MASILSSLQNLASQAGNSIRQGAVRTFREERDRLLNQEPQYETKYDPETQTMQRVKAATSALAQQALNAIPIGRALNVAIGFAQSDFGKGVIMFTLGAIAYLVLGVAQIAGQIHNDPVPYFARCGTDRVCYAELIAEQQADNVCNDAGRFANSTQVVAGCER